MSIRDLAPTVLLASRRRRPATTGAAVLVPASCLLRTWTTAKDVVRAVAPRAGLDAFLTGLDAELARGSDPAAVRRLLWSRLAGCPVGDVEQAAAGLAWVDRDDEVGRCAAEVVDRHRDAGDAVVVLSELPSFLAGGLAGYLGVERVVDSTAATDDEGRLTGAVPRLLLGAAAAEALAGPAMPDDTTAYGCLPADAALLAAADRGWSIGYDGRLRPVEGSRPTSFEKTNRPSGSVLQTGRLVS